MSASASELDAAVRLPEVDGSVVVREVMTQSCGRDDEAAVRVEAEEIDARFAVVGDVGPEI